MMSSLSTTTTLSDRALWLGLGLFTLVATRAVSHGLRTILALTTVTTPLPPAPLPSYPALHSPKESAIKTCSLETLATSPNIEIRKASTKLLCDRFYASEAARKLLARDLDSSDEEVKRKAVLALQLLWENGCVDDMVLPGSRLVRKSRGQQSLGWLRAGQRERSGDQDYERDLRRRRREAMVINEGDRPFSHEDVWMRDGEE